MATIKDVAAAANVSVSTASRALNDNPRISDATRQKVKQIATDLGYRSNYTARNLTRGESNIVGLVFPVTEADAPANPFHLDLMRGIAAALAPHNYEMAVAIGQDTEELLGHVKSLVEHSNVRRLLLFYSKENDPVAKYLREQHLNFVVIGHPSQEEDRYVDSNNISAGEAVANFLLEKKKIQKPLYVYSENNWIYERDRAQGLADGLNAGNIHLQTVQLKADGNLQAQVSSLDFDAVIASDDVTLLRCMKAGLISNDSAKDMPVICFNNSRLLSMLLPNVIKVDLLPRKLGAHAVNLLFNPKENHDQLGNYQII